MQEVRAVRVDFAGGAFDKARVALNEIKQVNLLIGPNNSGKSRLLDRLEDLTGYHEGVNATDPWFGTIFEFSALPLGHDSETAELRDFLAGILTSQDTSATFMVYKGPETGLTIVNPYNGESRNSNPATFWRLLAHGPSIFRLPSFHLRLNADRAIFPAGPGAKVLGDSGGGVPHTKLTGQSIRNGFAATTLLRDLRYENNTQQFGSEGRRLVNSLVSAAQSILWPYAPLASVTVQKVGVSEELVLTFEDQTAEVPLSMVGAGIQTVFLVTLFLEVLALEKKPQVLAHPHQPGVSLSPNPVFLFEELENNLHPALQRGLFEYVRLKARQNPEWQFWISTHSTVALDVFLGASDASVTMVHRVDGITTTDPVASRSEQLELLCSLGVRCSEVAIANGVIWVEGPSDRIYLKAAISEFDADLKEGVHFVFAFTAGAVAKHENFNQDLVGDGALYGALNPNYVFYCDRDGRDEANLKPWVAKAKDDAAQQEERCLFMMTNGYEMENYLPLDAVWTINAKPATLPAEAVPSEAFREWYKGTINSNGFDKVQLANMVAGDQGLVRQMLGRHGFREQIEEIIVMIKKWNGIP